MNRKTNALRANVRIAHLGRPLASSLRAAQALLDPAAILKELMENALDAKASRIDLRLRGTGCLSSIVVSDNGNGIKESDLERVCLPSTTSKLSQLVDIERISSFGFRGEALSAICGIARCVSIVSRTDAQSIAKCAQYAPGGALIRMSPAARGVGTTVNVEDVFHRLPVRKKEALAHPARQLARCIAVVQAAALISASVRIELRVGNDLKVANAPLLLQPNEHIATSSDSFLAALRRNATAVLGRSASALHEVSGCIAKVIRPGAEAGEEAQYQCSGLLSSASLNAKGGGRARSSQQYFFVNRRPVALPRLQRCATELYRKATGFNGASPVIILNFDLPLWAVDVNLSPDKRSVALFEEEKLSEGLERLLQQFWIPTEETQIPVSKTGDVGVLLSAKRQLQKPLPKKPGPHDPPCKHPDSGSDSQEPGHGSPASSVPHASPSKEIFEKSIDRRTIVEDIPELPCLSSDDESYDGLRNARNELIKETEEIHFESQSTGKDIIVNIEAENGDVEVKAKASKTDSPDAKRYGSRNLQSLKLSLLRGKRPNDVSGYVARRSSSSHRTPKRPRSTPSPPPLAAVSSADDDTKNEAQQDIQRDAGEITESALFDAPRNSALPQSVQPETVIMPVNWDTMCNEYITYAKGRKNNVADQSPEIKPSSSSFKNSSMQTCADEAAPACHQKAADNEMSRLFRQVWFKDLKVIGQFNRSFIIARYGSDLFIIDQHASDEKFNFEELERTTVISKQKLVRPMPLEFSAEDELIVQQYLDAFKAGGFGIDHDASKPPTQRLLLRSQPTSKHTIFVREDLQDMINLLKNSALHSQMSSISVLRPPRVRAMLASRACRKSIMVGRALSASQMETVLKHLADLQHPWTCPHGRPTMRHLFELPMT